MFVKLARQGSLRLAIGAMLAQIFTVAALPAPAAAMGTSGWTCRVRSDQPRPISLAPSIAPQVVTDQRIYDLDCTFTATAKGPSTTTLCLAIPTGNVRGSFPRSLRRDGGAETVNYSLFARPGDVPGAEASSPDERRDDLRPVYSVDIDHPDSGLVSFRHQFILETEMRTTGGILLPEGSYLETIDGVVISIHDMRGCGPILWGPNDGGIGTAAQLITEMKVGGACAVSIARPIDFGAVTDIRSPLRADGIIAVQCSSTLAYTVEIDGGTNAADGNRRLGHLGKDGLADGYLAYEILKPDGQQWGSQRGTVGGSAYAAVGDGTTQSIVATGRIPTIDPGVPAGAYRDSVIVTVKY